MSTSLGNEFAAGAVRGMGQAVGNTWWMSRWVYVLIVIVILYFLHANPPLWIMSEMKADSVGYSSFVGKWHDKKGRMIEWTASAKVFKRGDRTYDIEEPHIYALVGSPKMRFETELREGVLSHVFVIADSAGKWVSLSVDGGKATTYWRDKRKAKREGMMGENEEVQ